MGRLAWTRSQHEVTFSFLLANQTGQFKDLISYQELTATVMSKSLLSSVLSTPDVSGLPEGCVRLNTANNLSNRLMEFILEVTKKGKFVIQQKVYAHYQKILYTLSFVIFLLHFAYLCLLSLNFLVFFLKWGLHFWFYKHLSGTKLH